MAEADHVRLNEQFRVNKDVQYHGVTDSCGITFWHKVIEPKRTDLRTEECVRKVNFQRWWQVKVKCAAVSPTRFKGFSERKLWLQLTRMPVARLIVILQLLERFQDVCGVGADMEDVGSDTGLKLRCLCGQLLHASLSECCLLAKARDKLEHGKVLGWVNRPPRKPIIP